MDRQPTGLRFLHVYSTAAVPTPPANPSPTSSATPPATPSWRRDAILTLIVLVALVVLGIILRVRPSFPAMIIGSMGTLLVEFIAGRHEEFVHRVWAISAVRISAAIGAIASVLLLATLLSPTVISIAGSALTTYLILLVLVQRGTIPPPREWVR